MVRIPAFVTALVVGLIAFCTLPAALAEDSRQLQVEGQALSESLKSVADEFGMDIAFFSESTNGFRGVPLAGNYTSEEAFDTLLSDTGLEHRQLDNGTVVIQAKDKGGDSDSGNGRPAGATPRSVMMAQALAEQNQMSRRTATDSDKDDQKRPLEEIIVTGTNIRGIAAQSSPTRTFTREDIQITGAATAQDFINTLPQNFGGGSNENILILPNDSGAGFNGQLGTLGSSVNLRGLGSGSTLVLLNGHRVAPSSGIGDFIDISMIPASALERVETLTDGASSIYGADAVAGVVNFILRDDYDDVEASLRYGTVTEGDMDEYRASIMGGKSWGAGNAFVAYEVFNQTNLSAADRSFSQDALLPNDLLPSQRRHSVLASASQEVGSAVKLFTDLLFSTRDAEHTTSTVAVQEGLPEIRTPSTQNLNISAGGSWNISDTWFLDFSSTYSNVDQDVINRGALDSTRDVDSDLWTADAKTSGTLFSLPGGDVKLAVGGHYRSESFTSVRIRLDTDDTTERQAARHVYAAFGEVFIPIIGSDNELPGFQRLEINASGRYEDYSDFGSAANPKVGLLWSPFGGLNLRATYSTSFHPPPLGRVGATDLSVNSYPSALINSILGLTPADPSIADIVIISVNGTDKNLVAEESTAFTGGFDFSAEQGRHHFAASGTYFDIEYQDRLGQTPVPGNVTRFDVPNIWFNSPDAFPPGTVVFPATAEQINELLERVDIVNGLFGTDPLDAEMILISAVVRNLSLTFVRGFDFDITYSYETDFGEFSTGLDGTYLLDFERQAAVSFPIVEQLNTQLNPVDLKLRGRAGYIHNAFSANVFVNYTNSYSVDNTPETAPIDSWTTVDLSLSYDTQERFSNSILGNTRFQLSVANLFNEDPPATEVSSIESSGYDPTNASPLGRFIAFDLTKRF